MAQTIQLLTDLVSRVEAIDDEAWARIMNALDEAVHPNAQRPEKVAQNNDISRNKIYDEMAAGRLESFKVGNRRLISREAEARWRRHLEEEEAARRAAAGKAAA